ncbi:MAG TPA: hypothetical protein DEB39_13665 [Planctomycetaceae bacterium]|nr:hypothetical protein [Planctomycetaceae bacterium]
MKRIKTLKSRSQETKQRRLPHLLLIVAVLTGGFLILLYFFNASDIPLQRTVDDPFILLTGRFEPDLNTADPQNNGFRILFEAIGKNMFVKPPGDNRWTALCERLGLDPDTVPQTTWLPLSAHLEKAYPKDGVPPENDYPPFQKQRMAERKMSTSPWTLEEFPFMKDWLETNAEALDKIVEAGRSDLFFQPKIRTSSTEPFLRILADSDRIAARELIGALLIRSLFRINDPETADAAIDDAVAACRLGIHCSNSPWGLDRNPFAAEIALETVVELLRGDRLNAERLRRFAHEIDRFPRDPYTLEEVLDTGRYAALDLVDRLSRETIRRNDPLLEGAALPAAGKGEGIDWNRVAESVDRFFAETAGIVGETNPITRDLLPEYPAAVARQKLAKSDWYLPSRSGRSEIAGDAIAFRCVYSPKLLAQYRERRQTRIHLLRLAVALEQYRLEKGRYPETLALLEPKFIASVPGDPCLPPGTACHYVLEVSPNQPVTVDGANDGVNNGVSNGSNDGANPDPSRYGYLLYSVWIDRSDDRGCVREELMKKAYNGDVRVRMPSDEIIYRIPE